MRHLNNDQILILSQKLFAEERLTVEEGQLLAHCAFCSKCFDTLQSMCALLQVTEDMSLTMDIPEVEHNHSAVIQVVILDSKAIMEQLYACSEEMEFYAPIFSSRRGSGASDFQDIRLENGENHITYDPATKTLYITLCRTDGNHPHAFLKCGNRQEAVVFTEYDGLFSAQYRGLEEGEYQIIID